MQKLYGDKNIPDIDIGPLAKQYMCLYGVNVNLQRAIPQIQDGLKPVQRRMLYQLYTIYGKNIYFIVDYSYSVNYLKQRVCFDNDEANTATAGATIIYCLTR